MGGKKRGFTIYTGFEMLAGVAVAVLLLTYAYNKGTGIEFEKVYLTHDIALTINSLYGVPGDAAVDYNSKYMQQFKVKYDIGVNSGLVGVSAHSTDILPDRYVGPFPASSVFGFEATYHYAEILSHPITAFFQAPNYLAFLLNRGVITISNTAAIAKKTVCPTTGVPEDIKKQTLLFEPGHYENDKGNIGGDLEEYKITKQIADHIKILCSSKGYNCKFIQQTDLKSKIDEAKGLKGNLLVSIHIGTSGNKASITGPGDEKSSKLACLISGAMASVFQSTEEDKVDATGLKEDDPMKMIGILSPSVSIEMGNIKDSTFLNSQDNLAGAASAIIKGIEEYYSSADQNPGSNSNAP